MSHYKTAQVSYPVHSLIKKRWSARSFSSEPISETNVHTLLEAASWSASSMNEQPWKYVIARNGTAAFDRMIECLLPGNQPWAKDGNVLMISLAKKNFDRNGNENRHALHDVGASNTTLLLQAAELDIYGHMMGGFNYDKTLDNFEIDREQWEIACFIVIGYLNDADALEEPFKSRELASRSRNSIESFTEFIEK